MNGATQPLEKSIEKRVTLLEYWRNGNGALGAEARIVAVEKRTEEIDKHQACLVEEDQMEKMIEAVEQRTLKAVKEALHTKYAGIKAFSPYFAAICALCAAILVAIFK